MRRRITTPEQVDLRCELLDLLVQSRDLVGLPRVRVQQLLVSLVEGLQLALEVLDVLLFALAEGALGCAVLCAAALFGGMEFLSAYTSKSSK